MVVGVTTYTISATYSNDGQKVILNNNDLPARFFDGYTLIGDIQSLGYSDTGNPATYRFTAYGASTGTISFPIAVSSTKNYNEQTVIVRITFIK